MQDERVTVVLVGGPLDGLEMSRPKDPEKWTGEMRFNLRHSDDHLVAEFRRALKQERHSKRINGPTVASKGRRPLDRSFAAIENIDIKKHCKEVTSSRSRQRESVARKSFRPTTPEERSAWKLTIEGE